jgi:hypothetical protein
MEPNTLILKDVVGILSKPKLNDGERNDIFSSVSVVSLNLFYPLWSGNTLPKTDKPFMTRGQLHISDTHPDMFCVGILQFSSISWGLPTLYRDMYSPYPAGVLYATFTNILQITVAEWDSFYGKYDFPVELAALYESMTVPT